MPNVRAESMSLWHATRILHVLGVVTIYCVSVWLDIYHVHAVGRPGLFLVCPGRVASDVLQRQCQLSSAGKYQLSAKKRRLTFPKATQSGRVSGLSRSLNTKVDSRPLKNISTSRLPKADIRLSAQKKTTKTWYNKSPSTWLWQLDFLTEFRLVHQQ